MVAIKTNMQHQVDLGNKNKERIIVGADTKDSGEDSKDEHTKDELDIIDERCISQSTARAMDLSKLEHKKKDKERKSLKQLREEKATEKNFTSIRKFLASTKGGETSLGKQ